MLWHRCVLYIRAAHFADHSQLGASIQALGLLQHLYTPNALILVGRILAQIQITGAAVIHPDRSLLSLVLALAALNAVSILLHLLDFAGGMNGGMGIILDFIGQCESTII
jgi:hypothetical protein